MSRYLRIAAIPLLLFATTFAYWWSQQTPYFLPRDPSAFVAQFAPPPANDSPQTRAELDELLSIQASRTSAAQAAARADRKKDIEQFYAALAVDTAAAGRLSALREFMERVESDVSLYVRAAKHRFVRSRPYVLEARLAPCIDDVADNQSYPSGHATYGFTVALLLADMVPERRQELLARADEFGHHRMTCAVHYASDIAAGRAGAEWLVSEMEKGADFRAAKSTATDELRAAMKLPPAHPSG